jgi:hypothetical protein
MIEAGTHGAVVRQEALASNAALHLIDEKPAIKLAKGVWSSGRNARLVACTATGQAPRALHDDIGTIHAKYLASRVARLENEAWRTGHFALETHANEIAAAIRDFLAP